MESEQAIRKMLEELLSSQKLAVLATQADKQPYASLVAFVYSNDLKSLYFVTPRSTRKFTNLMENNRIALLVNSSTNRESDFHEAMAATIVGKAFELFGKEKETSLIDYISRHPYLTDFARSPTSALVKVQVSIYILVKNFQHVMELHIQ